MTTIPLGPSPAVRAAAIRRGRLLNRLTIGWNAIEGIVAVAAGLAAGPSAWSASAWTPASRSRPH